MKILDDKGMTLLELLVAIAVTFITLPIIYGVFSSGLKLYEKIQYEGQMRDDADYVSSMIINQMYSTPFDFIKTCDGTLENTCIELVDDVYSQLEKYTGENSTFYDINKEASKGEGEKVTIKVELGVNEKGKSVFLINGQALEVNSDFSNSKITYTCSNKRDDGSCNSAIINLDLLISNDSLSDTLQLSSQFGF